MRAKGAKGQSCALFSHDGNLTMFEKSSNPMVLSPSVSNDSMTEFTMASTTHLPVHSGGRAMWHFMEQK